MLNSKFGHNFHKSLLGYLFEIPTKSRFCHVGQMCYLIQMDFLRIMGNDVRIYSINSLQVDFRNGIASLIGVNGLKIRAAHR